MPVNSLFSLTALTAYVSSYIFCSVLMPACTHLKRSRAALLEARLHGKRLAPET